MSGKLEKEKAVSAPVGIFLMLLITILFAVLIAAIVFGMAGNISRVPYHVTVTTSEKEHIVVFVSNITTKLPLSNVQIGIYSHEKESLLIGPLFSNDSGLVDFETPDNFDDHYRVMTIYNGIKSTINIDKRPFIVRVDEFLGNLSTPLYTAIIALVGAGIAALIAYFKRDWLKVCGKQLSELFKDNDEL